MSEKTLNWVFLGILFILPFILYHDFLSGSRMLFGSDFIGSGGYAQRQWMADYISHHGSVALWVPLIYSGLPTVASFYADVFYPLSVVLRLLMPVHIAWTYTFILQIFVAGAGTYFFLKQFKLPIHVAFVMALAYMFCGSVVSNTHEGHDGRLMVVSLMPWVLLCLEWGVESGKLIGFLFSGAVIGLQLLSGQLQLTYYTGLAAVAYFGFRFFTRLKDDRQAGRGAKPALRLAVYFAVTLIFMVCLVAIHYLPVYGNVRNGVRGGSRGYEFATSWSMGPEETFDLITARFSGGLEHYWGRNPFKHHTEYLGILPLILALAGLVFCWRERIVKFFFGLGSFALLLAWGGHTPFYYIPYYLFPGVSKFRAPALVFFVGAFSLVVLAGFGLRYLMAPSTSPGPQVAGDRRPEAGGERVVAGRARITRFMLWTGGAGVGLLLCAVLGQGTVVSLLSSVSHSPASRIADNYGNFVGGMVLATVLILVNLGLLYALVRGRLRPPAYAAIAGLILIFDLWRVDSQFIKSYPPPSESFRADDAVTFLKKDPERFRVFPLYYSDPQTGMSKSDEGILMVHGIENVGGQHPNPLQNYMDFVGLDNTVMFNFPPNLRDRRFLDLLNVKYIISVPLPDDVSRYSQDQQQTIRMLKQYVSQPGLSLAWQSQQTAVYRNDSLLPRAFLVPAYEIVADKDAAIARLKSPSFDPRRTVLLAQEPGVGALPEGPIQGSAEVKSFEPDRIQISATLNRPGFLVLSEVFHPDWQASDNGRAVRIHRADQALRAVFLDAGAHTVEFRFKSKYFRFGAILSLLALIVLFAAGVWALVAGRRRTRRVIPA